MLHKHTRRYCITENEAWPAGEGTGGHHYCGTQEGLRSEETTHTVTCFPTPGDKHWQGHFKLSLCLCFLQTLSRHTPLLTWHLPQNTWRSVGVRVCNHEWNVLSLGIHTSHVWSSVTSDVNSFSSARLVHCIYLAKYNTKPSNGSLSASQDRM